MKKRVRNKTLLKNMLKKSPNLKNSQKKEEMNIDNEGNSNVGDFSSNLNAYSRRKGEFGRAKAKESHEKTLSLIMLENREKT